MGKQILEEMKERVVLCDGGLGSLLQAAGLKAGELPETWNILHPDVVRQIHLDYLRAGADIINANTFGANGLKYHEGADFSLPEVISAAFRVAKDAVREAGHGCVALDIGPTGKLLKPMGDLAFEDCVSLYAEVVREGVKCGADLIFIETMSDMYELKAAVLAAKENADLPVFATVVFDQRGRMLTGGTPEGVVALLEGLRVDALGINCSLGPREMAPIAERMIRAASVPVIINPNAGLPRTEGNRTVYDIGPEEFRDVMRGILDAGASVIGGCCGTTPAYIALLKEMAEGRKAPAITPKETSVVSSYMVAQTITDDPFIIGERINPTGKKRLKQALLEHDIDYILDLGLEELQEGAHALDVNVGLPGIDEAALLPEVVTELQSIIELPLQIDTADAAAMERALRIYNGKPLINSVNGKQEVMDAVFPLAAKYGGVIVALLLDEEGIPATADGRLAVARKILAEAEKYGIKKKDLLMDGLCMTVSSEQSAARVTLETIRRVREELGVRTVLGLSNISFGLPHREFINTTYLGMALTSGLNAVIMNPGSEDMMRTIHAYRALAGFDKNCLAYVEKYSNYEPPAPKMAAGAPGVQAGGAAQVSGTAQAAGAAQAAGTAQAVGAVPQHAASGQGDAGAQDAGAGLSTRAAALMDAIRRGLGEQASSLTVELLAEEEPAVIIDTCMIPALDRVGRDFEAGKVFLPQLLMSAEAVRAAFEIIKSRFAESGAKPEKKGEVILATVKGDIHDIGKNIVKVLLENYGYEVIDLGKDVPPERIVDEAKARGIRLVGLSALMTTTVAAMEETIKQLKAVCPDAKVAVGGAVLTEEYAAKIGADRYCKDAMATVNYAAEVLG